MGDKAYNSIHYMRFTWWIMVEGVSMRGILNYGIKVSKLSIDQVKLLGFQYGLFFGLGTFRCDILCYGWEQCLEEPIQEDPVVKLDFT